MSRKRLDLTGRVYGLRTVLHHIQGQQWLCRCVCGTESSVSSGNLLAGRAKTCGCVGVGRPSAHPRYVSRVEPGIECRAYTWDGPRHYVVTGALTSDGTEERYRSDTLEDAVTWLAAHPL